MNIYAKKGHPVVLVSLTDGRDTERKIASELLTVGDVYTVEKIEVNGDCAAVHLWEFPDHIFNSVFFEDLWDAEPMHPSIAVMDSKDLPALVLERRKPCSKPEAAKLSFCGIS